MSRTRLVRRPISLLAALTVCVCALSGLPADAAPAAAHGHAQHQADRQRGHTHHRARYLALGDSVSFGYREPANLPTPSYADAPSFVGYPELVAQALHLKLANAACPGETSGSLISTTAQSNGCETSVGGGPGYRSGYPLHVAYSGSQLAYAVKYLRQHRDTSLVTLMIGANDAFVCQETTSDQCASEFPAILDTIKANVTKTLKAIRHRARYRGQVVLVTYYSRNYGDAVQNTVGQSLNSALTAPAQRYRADVADGYGAFAAAAAQRNGDSCAAGLLTFLTTGGCGVHPSVGGQNVLAHALESVVRR